VAQYPITRLAGINWEAIPDEDNYEDLNEFLTFAGIPDTEQEHYRRNPIDFFPAHCYNFRDEVPIMDELEMPDENG
jgi:hypothetical protein